MQQRDSATEVRRSFLGWLIGAIAGLIVIVTGIPLVGFTVLPALRRRSQGWVLAGSVVSLDSGIPREFEVVVSIADGWRKTTRKKSIWVVKDQRGAISAYSAICPHLGCGYRWEAEQRRFHCPCHHSFFDLDGRVLSGPAPRALDTLPVKVEDGQLLVMYKEFKAGTSAKMEL